MHPYTHHRRESRLESLLKLLHHLLLLLRWAFGCRVSTGFSQLPLNCCYIQQCAMTL
jgi:hypothetical protein